MSHLRRNRTQQQKYQQEQRRREDLIAENKEIARRTAMIQANIDAEERMEGNMIVRRKQRQDQEREMENTILEVSLLMELF